MYARISALIAAVVVSALTLTGGCAGGLEPRRIVTPRVSYLVLHHGTTPAPRAAARGPHIDIFAPIILRGERSPARDSSRDLTPVVVIDRRPAPGSPLPVVIL